MRCKTRIIRTLLGVLLAAALTAGAASAAGTAVVNADSLRLRSTASTSASILAKAPKGAQVTLLSGEENGWYKVSYKDLTGYMSAQWLTVTGESEAPAGSGENGGTDSAAPDPAPVVTADTLNVRSAPDTGADRVGTLKKGTEVTILETQEDWYLVQTAELIGFVSAQYISLDGAVPEEGLVMTTSLNVRSGPGTGFARLGALRMGASVTILGEQDGWYQITSGKLSGYVSAQYVTLMEDLTSSPVGAAAAAMAVSLLGCRYVYGASGPNAFDCSGLSYYIYKHLGYTLQRGSSGQYNKNGTFVPLSQAEPGDLIFFFDAKFDGSGGRLPTTHMGICVGNGRFIHASTTSYRVQYDDIYNSYYTPYIVGVKRIG